MKYSQNFVDPPPSIFFCKINFSPNFFYTMTDHHNLSNTTNIPDTIHIAVVGSGGIGKSALSVQYVQSLFTEDYDPTIQDNYSKTALIDDNYVDLDILDTAGQDEFTALREQYMKNQDGFLLCFSLTSKETFERVHDFHKQIQKVSEKRLKFIF